MPHVRRVHELVAPYTAMPLDSDGMTKVISYLLARENISHAVHIGAIRVKDKGEYLPHSWIRLATGEIVDFRSRSWFGGDETIPHGVFKEAGTAVSYDGIEVEMPVSKVLFDVLTREPASLAPGTS